METISCSFFRSNLWISWAVLIAFIGCDNHFSATVYFCQIGGQFSRLLYKGVYYSAISINFITKLLNCDGSYPWHRIKPDSNLLNLENHISFWKAWVMVNNGKEIQLMSPIALHYSKCLAVRPKEPLTNGSCFSKEQRTYHEQPHSSPVEILNVFKILLRKQYLPWSKWLYELQREKSCYLDFVNF